MRTISRAAYAKWVPLIGREPWPMTADYEAAMQNHVIDLLQRAGETVAMQMGHRRVRLYTNQRFAENIALYRRLGYSVDREAVVAAGIVVHMSRMLPA